jgi:hypothetical protein
MSESGPALACGAKVTAVECPRCQLQVPVDAGDVTGMSLEDVIEVARKAAGETCPGHVSIGVGATPSGRQVVLHLWWSDGSISRQETYGPWAIADDESYLEQVCGFLRHWARLTGRHPDVATMAIVMDPAAWVRDREQQKGSDGGD